VWISGLRLEEHRGAHLHQDHGTGNPNSFPLIIQKLGLAARLPPQYPSRRLAVPQPPQSLPAGSDKITFHTNI
jgi:hypothetical protein